MTDRELEQLIDSALPGYTAAPAPGLNQRVLRRVRRRPLRWWPLAAIAAAAAAAVVMLPTRPSVAPVKITHLQAVASAPAPPLPVKRATVVPKPIPIPSDRFQNTPLSLGERRLALFAHAAPALAEQILVDAAQRMSEPLSIAPIAIESLNTTPTGVE